MKRRNKILSLLLSAALIGGMLPVPKTLAAAGDVYVSQAGDDSANGSQGAPFATIERAYQEVADGGSIILLDSLTLERNVSLNENKAVAISGATGGESITYTGRDTIPNTDDGMIAVRAGAVTFRDITLQLPKTPGVNGRVLYVGSGGEATLESGGTVAHGYLAYDGGGVLVDGGSFTMCAGSAVRDNYIANNTDCYGGGVSVQSGGSFVMEGGIIENNTVHTTKDYASYGGGIAVDATSSFTMEGGSIQNNRVDTHGGGLYIAPGAQATLGGNLLICDNMVGETADNLYLPQNAAFGLSGTVSGQVCVTCEAPAYNLAVGLPDGYAIQTLDEGAFSYDGGQCDIRLKEDKLLLYWFTVPVSIRLDGLLSENEVEETPVGQDYDTVLTPQEGYVLPDAVTVTVGGAALAQGSYTYNKDSGALHIPGSQVAGSIGVAAEGEAVRTITVETSNVISDVTTATAIRKDTVVITLTAADRYALPGEGDITITGECRHTYENGVLTLTDIRSDVTVKLQGAEVYHTIFFDAGEGSCDISSMQIAESQPTYGALPIPFRVGYSFEGWYSGDTLVTAGTANQLSGDLRLTARWVQKTNISYTIQHWMEYVDGQVNPGYEGSELQTMTHQGVTRQYYLYQSDCREDGISNGRLNLAERVLQSLSDGLTMDGITPSGANVYNVLVAPDGSSVYPLFYDRDRYTVRYNGNGGKVDGVQAATTVVYGGAYAVMPSASRAGYTLLGWFTEPRGGKQVRAGDVCLTANDQTLYAHWKPVGDTPYTVRHMTQNLKDNTVSQDKTPENYTLAHTDTLCGTSDTTVDLYAIAMEGFAPSKDNSYTLTILPDGSAVAYLYYDRSFTDVSFDSAGGSPVDLSMRLYYGGTFAFLPNPPTRVGYTFAGWYLGKNDTDRKVNQGDAINAIHPKGDAQLTLYAHWTPKTYPLTFETHGGVLSEAKTVTYGQPVGTLPVCQLTGYTFEGWYDKDGKLGVPEGNLISEDMVVNTDTLIEVKDGVETVKPLYAWYEPIQVSLTFDPAPGTLPEGADVLTVTYDRAFGDADGFPQPTLEGYTFRAWHLNAPDGEVLTETDICKLLADAKAFAEYTPNVYSVTLDADGGSVKPGVLLVTFNTPYGELPTPTRNGYTFLGWFDEAGNAVTAETVLNTPSAKTVTARWRAVTCGLTLDPNGGDALEEGMAHKTVTFDTPYGELPTPTRSGYIFEGWYTEQEKGVKVEAETLVNELADHVLFAHWRVRASGGGASRPAEYTLSFESNGGNLIYSVTAVRNTKVKLDKYRPSRRGYTFLGWFTDKELTQAAGEEISLKKDMTLYAKWEKKESDLMSMLERDAHMAYIQGFPDGTVRPGAEITRGEVAVVFYRLLTDQAKARYHASKSAYLDVPSGAWYHDGVATLTAMGILKGRGGNRFAPDSPITRGEFAAIAARFSEEKYDGKDLFTDIADSWARLEINRAASLGWVEGDPSGAFRPNDSITRAEAVTLINRVLGRAPQSADALLPDMKTFPDNANPESWYYLAIQEAANSHSYDRRQDGEVWTELK